MPNKTAGVQVGKESHTDPEIKALRELSLAVALELTGWDPDAAGRLLAAQGVDLALAENPAADLVRLVRAVDPPAGGACPACAAASNPPPLLPPAAAGPDPEAYPAQLAEALAQSRDNPGFAAKLTAALRDYGLLEVAPETIAAVGGGENGGKAAGRKKGGAGSGRKCPGCRREPKVAGMKLCARCQEANDRNKARQLAERDAAALAAPAAE